MKTTQRSTGRSSDCSHETDRSFRGASCASLACLAFMLLATYSRIADGQEETPTRESADTGPIVFVLDESGSMFHPQEKIEHTREAAKLGVMLLRGRVMFIRFADDATRSPLFDLPSQREEALNWIDSISGGSGTRYLPPLEALPARIRAVVLLSDGAPSEPTDVILKYVQEKVACPLHAIAMEATPEAESLLARMASLTQGAFYRVQQSAEVVEVFLRILGQVQRFRRYDMTGNTVKVADVQGELLAIGFDVTPEVDGLGRSDRYQANLPGSKVHLTRVTLTQRQTVTVTAERQPSSHAVVLRFDLTTSAMQIRRIQNVDGGTSLKAEVEFRDPTDQAINVRGQAHLKCRFEAVEPDGKVAGAVDGQPSADGKVLEAILKLPRGSGGRAYNIRGVSVDESSGLPFASVDSRIVVPETLPALPELTAEVSITAAHSRLGSPLRFVVEVSASCQSPQSRQSFLQAIAANPPTFRVTSPDGRTTTSATSPERFQARPPHVGEDTATFEVTCHSAEQAGEYVVGVLEGKAAGFGYPSASSRVRHGGSELQMLLVSQRSKGRYVISDSEQDLHGHAIVGDRFRCELVRGTMDPRVFVSLGPGLRAFLIGEDGALTRIPLRLENNRYVTEPVPLDRPGKLRVQVDIAVEEMRLRFDTEISIERVIPSLRCPQKLLFDRMGRLPRGTMVPFEVDIIDRLGAQTATPEDLAEVIQRDQLRIRRALTDSADEEISHDSQAAGMQRWQSRVWLPRSGRQTFAFELVDSGGVVLDSLGWQFEAIESPVKFTVLARGLSGRLEEVTAAPALASWLPASFLSSSGFVLHASVGDSPFTAAYFLSAVMVGDSEAQFDEQRGCFVCPIPDTGVRECVGRLSPIRMAGMPGRDLPELQVLERLTVPQRVLWGRLVLAALVSLGTFASATGGMFYFARNRYARTLMDPQRRITLLGESADSWLLPPPEQRRWWPARELLVCRWDAEPNRIFLVCPDDIPAGATVIARVHRHRDHSVSVLAVEDVEDMRKGERRSLDVGDETVRITETTALVLEFPDAIVPV